MKIGFFSVAHISFGGGYEQQIARLAIELAKRKKEITIITLSERGTYILAIILSFLYFHPRFSFPELKKKKTSLKKYKNIRFEYFSSLNQLKKIISKQDIIYAKNEIIDNLLLKFTKYKKKPRFICGIHTLLFYTNTEDFHARLHNIVYGSFFYKFLINFYDQYHCINREQVKFIQKKLGNKSITYIPNFVNMKITLKKHTSSKVLNVLFVGRLSLQKGIDTFIDIFDKLTKTEDFSHIVIRVCGAGAYEQEIKNIAKKNKNVMYLGFLSEKEMKKVYSFSDILVTTSRGEAFPVACLEALAYGLPILGFKVSGVSDIIIQGKNGRLIPYGDIEGFVEEVTRFYKLKRFQKTKFFRMSQYGQHVIKSQYSATVLMKKYQNLFNHGN